MKRLLTISFILIGMTGWGQEVYLKNVVAHDVFTDESYLYATVDYDENWKVTAYREYHSWGDIRKEISYSNDTIIETIFPDKTYYFDHAGDTIIVTDSQGGEQFYVVNEHYQITSSSNGLSMEWAVTNLVKLYYDDELQEVYLYTGFKNPYFNVFKTFKGDCYSSYSQIEEALIVGTEYSQYWDVTDGIYNYPTEIIYYVDGEQPYTFYYYYHIVTGTTETEMLSAKTLSVSYYNLLGQRIQKPTKGFYIERKTTNQGVISNKYFIP